MLRHLIILLLAAWFGSAAAAYAQEPRISLNDVHEPACRDAAAAAATRLNVAPGTKQVWPFDVDLVAEVIKDSVSQASKRADGDLNYTVVRVVDLGFEGVGSHLPVAFLAAIQNEIMGNRTDDPPINHRTDDRFGFSTLGDDLERYPNYEPQHGGAVVDLILGGAALRKLVEDELKHLIKLTLVKAIKDKNSFGFHASEVSQIVADPPRPDIVHLSVGTRRVNDMKEEFLKTIGDILVVVAAGNDQQNLSDEPPWVPAIYATFDFATNMLVVGAHDGSGAFAYEFSNYHPNFVHLLAPGCALPYTDSNGVLHTMHGTSFAAPLVTFTAALLRTFGIERPLHIRDRILASVDYDETLKVRVASSGRLNIAKALSVYDDVLEVRLAPGEAPVLAFGNWVVAPGVQQAFALCKGGLVRKDNLVKVTPVRQGGNLLLQYHARSGALGFVGIAQSCSPQGDGIVFKVLRSEGDKVPTGEAVFKWDVINDIVPSFFKPL